MDSIAFVLYDKNAEQSFGLICETKPPFDERFGESSKFISAAGGSFDVDNLNMFEICLKEVYEESGYNTQMKNIHYIGEMVSSTQMNEIVYLFLIDVTGIETEHDGENGSHFVWLNYDQVLRGNDWKSIVILTIAENMDLL